MTSIAPWRIETETGTITANWLDGRLFDTNPGAEITATFAFISSGVDGTPADRHAELQPLVDAAQEGRTVRTDMAATGRPYYVEDLAGFSDVGSLLVALVPEEGAATGDRQQAGAGW